MEERIKKCFDTGKCRVPKECYQYYITYTKEGDPRLQATIDWKCVERTQKPDSKKWSHSDQ